jgi:hypothetical protein
MTPRKTPAKAAGTTPARENRAVRGPREELKGWKSIAEYLAIPVSTAHRWAKAGMPVRKGGRVMVADAKELSAWLGRTAHMPGPAEILTNQADVAAALKESIAAMRRGRKKR